MLESIVAVVVIFGDQLTKHLIEVNMHLWQSISLIKGVLSFTYAKNTGIGFSFFQNHPKVVEGINIAVIVGLIVFSLVWRERKNSFFQLSMGLLIGGASSNIVSRIVYGSVTDFIHLPYWPIFNVADSCVVAGAIGLGLYFLKREEKSGKG